MACAPAGAQGVRDALDILKGKGSCHRNKTAKWWCSPVTAPRRTSVCNRRWQRSIAAWIFTISATTTNPTPTPDFKLPRARPMVRARRLSRLRRVAPRQRSRPPRSFRDLARAKTALSCDHLRGLSVGSLGKGLSRVEVHRSKTFHRPVAVPARLGDRSRVVGRDRALGG